MGFEEIFGGLPEYIAEAPGRVNLIGEHTDYNGGYVLPAVIPQTTSVGIRRNNDRIVRAFSENVSSNLGRAQYRLGEERRTGGWIDYVQGVTEALAAEGFEFSGFDIYIRSDVPLGSGLSSSAAMEVSLLRALRRVFSLPLDDVRIAFIGKRAENNLVGAPVGIMDQLACSLGSGNSALFIDTRSLETKRIAIPAEAGLIVINSGIMHNHAAGDYKTRRAECERAAAWLGVAELRDVEPERLYGDIKTLPEPLGRRVRHVITENERVLLAVSALEQGNLEQAGQLFYASHASMRDDYEVSIPEIDQIVEIAKRDASIWGARLTGGGFGGSVVMLAKRGEAAEAAVRIAREYSLQCKANPAILVPRSTA